MLHSVEVFLPVVKVVLEGPVTVVAEVSFPHLSSGRAASARLGNHQPDPRRPATPAPGMDDPRFTAPASKGEELKSFRAGRQRKRRDPTVNILVHQGLARQRLLHIHGGDGLDLHFLSLLPKATTALLKEISFPELRGPKTETLESQQLPAPREMQQKPYNVQTEGIRGHSLHLGPQDVDSGTQGSPSCHARGRKFPHVHLYKARKRLRSSSKMLNQLLSPVLHIGSRIANTEGHIASFSSFVHCCASRTALLILPSPWQ